MVNWQEIDAKWQLAWREARVFEAEPDKKPKFYITVAYPYVSGPMHVGHAHTYTIPDVIARYKRMRGFNVLFPMAYHFTGTPIVGATKRIARREPDFVKTLIELFGVPESELAKFEDPHYFATYFARVSDLSYRKGMGWLGYSFDWRREFTTVDSQYSKFITWQYNKLMGAGLILKGTHPVKWCPSCKNPVTDHDLLEGEGVGISEFTLLKYRFGDHVLPAATLRPETVFGVTNLWLNPGIEYVRAEVGEEKWIISPQAVEKLRGQGYRVGKVAAIEETLIGKEVEVPLTHKRVPILPAEFADPENATGVVGSVPAHAPYDYIALLELQHNPEKLRAHGIDPSAVEKLQPISLIELRGFGECPAVEMAEKMGIKTQTDPLLEEATAEVYRNEFAKGIMRDWVPIYGNLPVSRAKLEVRNDMIASGEAASMHEFSERPVICRCGTDCTIKVVEDQWFLNYSDGAWKEKARDCLSRMQLVPPETRTQYEHVIDWLHEWPCTRSIGMGTHAPWDPKWMIESLSDSTIYMAYYTISHVLKMIEPEKLNDEVFDYVFIGTGDAATIASATSIEREKLERMRKEFEYWYPLDYRASANELIPNHLTFLIFHHTAIFPPELWPRGILTYGMTALEGRKMSSSKGNIIPINQATRKYGADAVRLYLISAVEPWEDFDWLVKEADSMLRHLDRFYALAEEIVSLPAVERPQLDQPDCWMLSRLQERIRATTQALEGFKTREAIQHAFFLLNRDLRRYMKRSLKPEARKHVLKRVLGAWVRLLAPFLPHACEEIWQRMGGKGFVSVAKWPEVEEKLVDKAAELIEDYLERTLEDIREILRVTKIERPKRACLYVAEDWKSKIFAMALERAREGRVDVGELIQAAKKLGLEVPMADLAKYAKRAVSDLDGMPKERLAVLAETKIDEQRVLMDARDFFRGEIGAEVQIFKADDQARYDPKDRAKQAMPLRTAIYIE